MQYEKIKVIQRDLAVRVEMHDMGGICLAMETYYGAHPVEVWHNRVRIEGQEYICKDVDVAPGIDPYRVTMMESLEDWA